VDGALSRISIPRGGMRGQLRSQVPYALRTHRIVSFAPMPYAFVRSYGGCRAETNLWWLVNDRNNNAKDSFYRFARTNDMVFSFDKRETFSGTTYLSVHTDDPKHLSPQKKALNEQDDLFYRPSNGSPQGSFESIHRRSLLDVLPATGDLQRPPKQGFGGHDRRIGRRRRRPATTGIEQDSKLLEIRQNRRQGNRRKIRNVLAAQHHDLVVSHLTLF
jgi:hypothetical protein